MLRRWFALGNCCIVWCILATSCSPIPCSEALAGSVGARSDDSAKPIPEAVPLQALHPGDQIAIRVPGHEQLAATVRVPANGELVVPQLGSFPNPAGGSLDGFAEAVAQRIHDQWVRDAAVDVAVDTYGPRRAYVLGSVDRPGVVELDPFTDMTAMKAISVAGGFAEDANRKRVRLVRTDLLPPSAKHHLELHDLDQPGSPDSDRPLQHGDLIVVERLDQVYVMGEVSRPGAVNLQPDGTLTVLKAISVVGGFDRFARRDRVQLIRDSHTIRVVDLRRVLAGEADAIDPSLQPGDIVFVQGSDW